MSDRSISFGTSDDLGGWCIQFAGLLAEWSVVSVVLTRDGVRARTLNARETDLPGEIRRSIPCTLEVSTPMELKVWIGSQSVHWETSDQTLAGELALLDR